MECIGSLGNRGDSNEIWDQLDGGSQCYTDTLATERRIIVPGNIKDEEQERREEKRLDAAFRNQGE